MMKPYTISLLVLVAGCPLPGQPVPDAPPAEAAQKAGAFLVRFFPSERGKISDRLTVQPWGKPEDAASGIELLITDETYYDRTDARFQKREVAYISGPGLGTLGLFFVVEDLENVTAFGDLLQRFIEQEALLARSREEIHALDEEWVGDGINALAGARDFGRIQLAGRPRESTVTMNWSFDPDRVWLSFDEFININREAAPLVLELVRNIPAYSEERARLRQELAQRRRQVLPPAEQP